MTAYSFDTIVGQSIAFDQDADVLNIAYDAESISVTESGSDLIISVTGVGSVTLQGTTLGELVGSTAGGDTVNIALSSGSFLVGDNTSNDALDAVSNTVNGTTGNDLIYGQGGADTLTSGATGNDVIFGGTAITDTTDGGDTITANSTGNVTVYSNAGDDTVTLGITASGSTANIFTGLGGDTVNLAAAAAGSTVNITLADGNDTIVDAAVAGELNITGGSGADVIDTSSVTGDATIYGGAALADSTDGGDTITLGVNNAVAYGNGGVDTITYNGKASGTQTVNGGRGDDVIVDGTGVGAFTLAGGWDDDSITVNNDAGITSVVVYGGNAETDTADGDDTISVTAGAALASATLLGNSGTDTITYNGTDNTVTATASINGGVGDDTVTVTASANDTVTVNTSAGNDTVNVTTTGDSDVIISGFDSSDTLSTVSLNGSAVTAWTAAQGSSTVIDAGANGSIVLGSYLGDLDLTVGTGKLVANFVGGVATVTGTANVDYLVSGSSADTIVLGGGGNDKVDAGLGDDVISAVDADIDGNDVAINGGDGADSLTFTDAATVSAGDLANITNVETITFGDFTSTLVMGTASEAAGIVTVDASAMGSGNTLGITDTGAVASDATVTGGAGNDSVVLDSATGDLNLVGNGGDDTLTTNSGTDSVDGGAGNDTIVTGAANDTIDGGAGTDDITGGAGVDSLTGGADADDFIFTAATESTSTAVDVITDFSANGDTIDFDTTTGSGNATSFTDGTGDDYDTGNATLEAAADAFMAAINGSTGADAAGIFSYGGKTYVVINDDNDGTFETGDGDLIVDISGYSGTFDVADFVLT